MLDFAGQRIELRFEFGIVAVEQDGRFAVAEALAQGGLVQDFPDARPVAAFAARFCQRLEHFGVVDEFIGVGGGRLIHGIRSYLILI